MKAAQLQNLLLLVLIFGLAAMEIVTRRYKETVHATANDTKLELFMFLSLLAITQPLAILVTGQLGAWLIPEYQALWPIGHGGPWWACSWCSTT